VRDFVGEENSVLVTVADDSDIVSSWHPHSLSGVALAREEVHLWRFALRVSDSVLERFREILSEDEIARAERFRFPHLRRRFVVGRGSLRTILGGYLGIEPRHLRFAYSAHGKPSLLEAPLDIQFNVSHSDDLMVAALCRESPVGVDIEKQNPEFHALEIAARYFCKRERDEIVRRGAEAGQRAFFQFWTAKEAVLKATSLGLALDLSKLEIDLSPLRMLNAGDSAKINGTHWHLTAFSPREGYSGALAAAWRPVRLDCRDFLPPLAPPLA
jgi:4'-phosphopantetheinyl transferase